MGAMEQDTPQWVEERAKCDVGHLFACIRQLVQRDVQSMVTVLRKQEQGVELYFHPNDLQPRRFTVQRLPTTNESFTLAFEYNVQTGNIDIANDTPHGKRCQTITTRWDEEKAKCRLVVQRPEGEPIEFPHKHLWKVVQYILEPFFFPPRSTG